MDAILFWNEVALEAVALDHTSPTPGAPAPLEQGGPTRTSRALAIVHLAMYDAFNSIDLSHAPYQSGLPLPAPGASANAAIGAAALITLQRLYPRQYSRLLDKDQDFQAGLAEAPQSIADGQTQGEQVAEQLLALRRNDGSRNTSYTPRPPKLGDHGPDPLNPKQGLLTPFWGNVQPFGIPFQTEPEKSAFRASPPPPLDSSRYEVAFSDVKEKGSLTGSTRTWEETTVGLYWAYDGAQKLGTPPRLYNQIVRQIVVNQGNTLAQNARLFALVNMAMADAGIQCWESKYYYNLWRPVLGIREADPGWGSSAKDILQPGGDGNPETEGDPYWLPLGAPRTNEPGQKSFTPGFPAYPSGHATFGAASLDMVRLFYNSDAIGFSFVSDELNGESVDIDGSVRTYHRRSFSRLSDAIDENGRSRVYLGVHWQFDADAGIVSGKKIADYLYSNFLN
jgi:membrane-associated phospholipid phosphatase